MAAFHLSDFFIGQYPIILNFGEKPDVYAARYNFKGNPGIDISCPTMTPVLAAADGYVLSENTVFEKAGLGKFIVIVHDGFLSVYGHLNDILTQKNQKVVAGQLIGHSNQSGLADVQQISFRVAPCDAAGVLTEPDNGYGGYIDPMASPCVWDIKNLTEPVIAQENTDKVELTSREFAELSSQAANYKIILSYLGQTNFDEYLKEEGKPPIDSDPSTGGEKIVFYVKAMLDEVGRFYAEVDNNEPEAPKVEVKPSFLTKLANAVLGFILK